MLHLYVHGRGLGHATRAAVVARALSARGHAVRMFAGGDALALLGDAAEPVQTVRNGPDVHTVVRRRAFEAACAVRADLARVVISDGDLPALLGARSAGVPAIAIGHGLVFSHCHRPAYAPAGPWYREAVRVVANTPSAATAIAVGFAPLRPRPRCIVARPTVEPIAPGSRERCVCYFRDGAPRLLERLVRLGARPLLFAAADPGLSGVEHHPLERGAFLAALASARVAITSAGSQILSECAAGGIPLFAVHGRNDDEQRLNVAMARAIGIASGCCIDDVDDARLAAFIERAPRPSALDIALPAVDEAVCNAVLDLVGARRSLPL